jgi:flagellar hook assembly protein FlgD
MKGKTKAANGARPMDRAYSPTREQSTRVRFAIASANPTREGTLFAIELHGPAAVRLSVYDASGRSVASVLKTELPAGAHTARWSAVDDEGRRVPAGVYYARFSAAGPGIAASEVRRVVVLP